MPLTKHEADRLMEAIRAVMNTRPSDDHGQPAIPASPTLKPLNQDGRPATVGKLQIDRDQLEAIYRELKNRLIDDLRTDPILLKLVAAQPEIVIEFEPRVIEMDGMSLKGRLARLIASGFFNEPKRQGTARSELARTGPDCNSGNLSTAFNDFVRDGFLVRDGDSFTKAPGLKVTQRNLTTS